MSESTMKTVAMLRELADEIEKGHVALCEVRKSDRHETIKIQGYRDRYSETIPTGIIDVELTLNYRRYKNNTL